MKKKYIPYIALIAAVLLQYYIAYNNQVSASSVNKDKAAVTATESDSNDY